MTEVDTNPLFYLVQIRIDRSVAEQWERWMREVHVGDVIDTGCFEQAWICREPERDQDGLLAYRMIYLARSQRAFEQYQSEFAAQLQADHTDRYRGKFEASRQLCPVVDSL